MLKKFVLAVLILVCQVVVAHSDPYAGQGSSWKNKNTTIVISSSTPTLIAASGGGYRAVTLGDPLITTTVFYTIDESSASVPTRGMWFVPSNIGCIEYNGKIWLQLGAGSSSITLRECISGR
jgi:hypothetical protein